MSESYDQQIREGVQQVEQAAQVAHDEIARIHQHTVNAVWPVPSNRKVWV